MAHVQPLLALERRMKQTLANLEVRVTRLEDAGGVHTHLRLKAAGA